MTARVLITGTTGFIGSHVVAAARTVPGLRLRLMTHRTALPASAAPPGAETVYGDLADPATLRGSCEGVDAVIHCASWIGGDEPTARSVNAEGTRALVEEADRCGVTRIVYLSTASVYGRGPFTGLRPGQAEPAPASATSLTRAAAEQHVLAAGGAVVRPHLVYGAGDRWAVPGLVGLLRQLSAVPAGCRARHSMIDVEALGRALLSAALSPKEPAGVYHVNHPEPVRSSQLLSTVVDELRLPWGTPASTWARPASGSRVCRTRCTTSACSPWTTGSPTNGPTRTSTGSRATTSRPPSPGTPRGTAGTSA